MKVLRHVLLAIALSACVMTGFTFATATPASAATLFPCDPYNSPYTYLCTRITSAPAHGVQVKDRNSGYIYTLHNGDSVVLASYNVDDYGLCAINGDPFVWKIGWVSQGRRHLAVIGDWYLATGSFATWRKATDSWGRMDNAHHRIPGNTNNRATCDRIQWWDGSTYPS